MIEQVWCRSLVSAAGPTGDRDPSRPNEAPSPQPKGIEEESETLKKRADGVLNYRRDVFTIPNVLSMARIAGTPVIGYLIVNEKYGAALTGVVLAGITDLLDGYIARHYDEKSPLGTVLDPFADKLLMTTLVLSLAASGAPPPCHAMPVLMHAQG